MDLLSVPEYVIMKGRCHGHRYGKSQKKNNIIWLINYRRNAERNSFKESMIDSYKIKNSLFEWLKIIETKKFVLPTKITRIICSIKSTTTRTNGGSLNKSVSDTPPLRRRSEFQASIVYFATVTTKCRRRITRACLLLQAQTMGVGTEFIFYMVELARLLVVFL